MIHNHVDQLIMCPINNELIVIIIIKNKAFKRFNGVLYFHLYVRRSNIALAYLQISTFITKGMDQKVFFNVLVHR